MQCKARSKRSGAQCKRHVTPGMTVCRMHGGKTPVGLALPQTKTGRYSKYLPARLLARYEAAQADPLLLDLHAEIALLDSRLADVLQRVDTGESARLWAQAQTAWRQMGSPDAGEAAAGRATLETLLTTAAVDYAAWEDIYKLIAARQRLVESERKRLVEMQQMVRVDQALLFVTALMESVKRHVTDPRLLSAIAADLARLTGDAGGAVIDGRAAPE